MPKLANNITAQQKQQQQLACSTSKLALRKEQNNDEDENNNKRRSCSTPSRMFFTQSKPEWHWHQRRHRRRHSQSELILQRHPSSSGNHDGCSDDGGMERRPNGSGIGEVVVDGNTMDAADGNIRHSNKDANNNDNGGDDDDSGIAIPSALPLLAAPMPTRPETNWIADANRQATTMPDDGEEEGEGKEEPRPVPSLPPPLCAGDSSPSSSAKNFTVASCCHVDGGAQFAIAVSSSDDEEEKGGNEANGERGRSSNGEGRKPSSSIGIINFHRRSSSVGADLGGGFASNNGFAVDDSAADTAAVLQNPTIAGCCASLNAVNQKQSLRMAAGQIGDADEIDVNGNTTTTTSAAKMPNPIQNHNVLPYANGHVENGYAAVAGKKKNEKENHLPNWRTEVKDREGTKNMFNGLDGGTFSHHVIAPLMAAHHHHLDELMADVVGRCEGKRYRPQQRRPRRHSRDTLVAMLSYPH